MVQPAKTTAIIPNIPIALYAKGPGATGGASPFDKKLSASGDFKYTAYNKAAAIQAI